mmetsp:Transcript_5211/g.19495  ORF Transcript_5211/g.19495 Transcript_5211/m.19495 type:complete len:575 (+) Transcript_5211:174-1898(+)|eukprot:CAMPEP_0117442732 /NCGR_PEP_ID=MMETSP0759-20121206/4310_1 /TAXON_ID=63605 /ORGANISM="Percolomonas cosmopolitus, Strain WS" /LENGTH=574 /DNA_ID=CAMNT_0005234643 /DNA_START=169 /DNA_END=1893 /DNA_ORIENTATION=+
MTQHQTNAFNDSFLFPQADNHATQSTKHGDSQQQDPSEFDLLGSEERMTSGLSSLEILSLFNQKFGQNFGDDEDETSSDHEFYEVDETVESTNSSLHSVSSSALNLSQFAFQPQQQPHDSHSFDVPTSQQQENLQQLLKMYQNDTKSTDLQEDQSANANDTSTNQPHSTNFDLNMPDMIEAWKSMHQLHHQNSHIGNSPHANTTASPHQEMAKFNGIMLNQQFFQPNNSIFIMNQNTSTPQHQLNYSSPANQFQQVLQQMPSSHYAGVSQNHPGVTSQHHQRPKAATSATFQAPFNFNNIHLQRQNSPTKQVHSSSHAPMGSPTFLLREAFQKNVNIHSPTPMESAPHQFGSSSGQRLAFNAFLESSGLSGQMGSKLHSPVQHSSVVKMSKVEPNSIRSNGNHDHQTNSNFCMGGPHTEPSNKRLSKSLTIDTSPSTQNIPHAFGQKISQGMMGTTPVTIPAGVQPSERPMTAPPRLYTISPFILPHRFDQNLFFQRQRLTKPNKQVKHCKMKTKKCTTGKGLWSDEEHQKFLEGLERFGRSKWKEIAEYIGTRTRSQVSSHSQKYFKKLHAKR